jgi:KDO2-lipid IV(A) lauroyltransferase
MKKFLKKIRHLLEYYIFLVMIKVIGLFGIDRAATLCANIARRVGPLLRVNLIAKRNLQNVFGQDNDYTNIISKLWENFGRFIGEFPYINDMSEEEVAERVKFEGVENLAEFQKMQQPFLLFTGHFANWDIALRRIDTLYPKFGVVYRKSNNPYIDKIINKTRSNRNINLIPKGPYGAKSLIKSIKSGHAIAMLVDQKMNDGIEVPFFGRPAMTSHAIAKFAIQFNYPIIPCQIIRTFGSNFKVIIHPALQLKQTDNIEQDCYNIMLQINKLLESWIIEYPEQWLWFHNRWKKEILKQPF